MYLLNIQKTRILFFFMGMLKSINFGGEYSMAKEKKNNSKNSKKNNKSQGNQNQTQSQE